MRPTLGPYPASPNAMILDVPAFRGVVSQCASCSSAGDISEKTSPALEPHAHLDRTHRRAETSRIIAFVLAGCGSNVDLRAHWPPPFRVGHAKRYNHRGFGPLVALQRVKTSMVVAFGVSYPEGWRSVRPEAHIGTAPREHKRYDSRGFGSPVGPIQMCVWLECGRRFFRNVTRTRTGRTSGEDPPKSRNIENHSVCARGVWLQCGSHGSLVAPLLGRTRQTLHLSRFSPSGGPPEGQNLDGCSVWRVPSGRVVGSEP